MFKRTLYIYLLFTLFISCDNTIDIYEEANEAPTLQLRKYNSGGGFSASFVDSFRVSDGDFYFEYNLDDELNYEDLSFSLSFSQGSGSLASFDDETFIVKLSQSGVNAFSVTATDIYGLSSQANASVFVFENLKPVANLSVVEYDTYYLFDCSDSYDADRNFGGSITQYEITINGNNPITFTSPTLEYQGLYIEYTTLVSLRVKDNSGEWSETVTKIIYP